jgi:hypothetical protein
VLSGPSADVRIAVVHDHDLKYSVQDVRRADAEMCTQFIGNTQLRDRRPCGFAAQLWGDEAIKRLIWVCSDCF